MSSVNKPMSWKSSTSLFVDNDQFVWNITSTKFRQWEPVLTCENKIKLHSEIKSTFAAFGRALDWDRRKTLGLTILLSTNENRVILRRFPPNIRAIKTKIELPKKPYSMVTLWIQLGRTFSPARENWIWSRPYFD